eukprot:4846828-Prymnesium_polylepis.1
MSSERFAGTSSQTPRLPDSFQATSESTSFCWNASVVGHAATSRAATETPLYGSPLPSKTFSSTA